MICSINKFQIQMEERTLQKQMGLTSLLSINSLCYGVQNQRIYSISNSMLQALISLEKAPFVVEEEQIRKRKIGVNQVASEKIQPNNLHYSRKQKSLEQLSQKFLNKFQGKDKIIIDLDKVTEELNVQKRRIYDVINILQCLKVVSKNGKNNYKWKGLYQAIKTIELCKKDKDSLKVENVWKEKSLEYLASGLVKLFLHWKPVVTLDQAAKQIMKDLSEEGIKAKNRRLYDIINVFKSLKLVKKTSLPNKKPGFSWLGTSFLQDLIVEKNKIEKSFKHSGNLKLQVEKSEYQQYKQTKPSFFAELLQEKVGRMNLENVSQLLIRKIWPLTPLPISKSQLEERSPQLINN